MLVKIGNTYYNDEYFHALFFNGKDYILQFVNGTRVNLTSVEFANIAANAKVKFIGTYYYSDRNLSDIKSESGKVTAEFKNGNPLDVTADTIAVGNLVGNYYHIGGYYYNPKFVSRIFEDKGNYYVQFVAQEPKKITQEEYSAIVDSATVTLSVRSATAADTIFTDDNAGKYQENLVATTANGTISGIAYYTKNNAHYDGDLANGNYIVFKVASPDADAERFEVSISGGTDEDVKVDGNGFYMVRVTSNDQVITVTAINGEQRLSYVYTLKTLVLQKFTVRPVSGSTQVYDKTADDLQTALSVTYENNAIDGDLNYVTGYAAFGSGEQDGHYVAVSVDAPDNAIITGEVVDTDNTVLVSDNILVAHVAPQNSIKIAVTIAGKTIEQEFRVVADFWYPVDTSNSVGCTFTNATRVSYQTRVTISIAVDAGYTLPDTITINGETGASSSGSEIIWQYIKAQSAIEVRTTNAPLTITVVCTGGAPAGLTEIAVGQTLYGVRVDPTAVPTRYEDMDEWMNSIASDAGSAEATNMIEPTGDNGIMFMISPATPYPTLVIMGAAGGAYYTTNGYTSEDVTLPKGWSTLDENTGTLVPLSTVANISFGENPINVTGVDVLMASANGVILGAILEQTRGGAKRGTTVKNIPFKKYFSAKK